MTRRRPISYADPLHLGRHPFQTYMLALCFVSGLPLLLGHVTSKSIEETLPLWMAITWGWSLFLGSTIGLVGSYWPGSYANGLTIERCGLILVGCAGLLYACVAPLTAGWNGVFAACIIAAFSAACLKRSYDIGTIMQRAVGIHNRPVSREGETASDTEARDRQENA